MSQSSDTGITLYSCVSGFKYKCREPDKSLSFQHFRIDQQLEHSSMTFGLPTLSVTSEENGRCVNMVYVSLRVEIESSPEADEEGLYF